MFGDTSSPSIPLFFPFLSSSSLSLFSACRLANRAGEAREEEGSGDDDDDVGEGRALRTCELRVGEAWRREKKEGVDVGGDAGEGD